MVGVQGEGLGFNRVNVVAAEFGSAGVRDRDGPWRLRRGTMMSRPWRPRIPLKEAAQIWVAAGFEVVRVSGCEAVRVSHGIQGCTVGSDELFGLSCSIR